MSVWVRHSSERVRSALVNSGLVHPRARLTVNLAPADLRKEGPAYDLPIAVGILLASEQVGADLSDAGLVGELSLDGQAFRGGDCAWHGGSRAVDGNAYGGYNGPASRMRTEGIEISAVEIPESRQAVSQMGMLGDGRGR